MVRTAAVDRPEGCDDHNSVPIRILSLRVHPSHGKNISVRKSLLSHVYTILSSISTPSYTLAVLRVSVCSAIVVGDAHRDRHIYLVPSPQSRTHCRQSS